jgi:hypothetical protein
MNIGNYDRQQLNALQDAMLSGANRPENSYEFLLTIANIRGVICGRISKWSLIRGIQPDADFLVGGSPLDPESHSGPTETELWYSQWREPESAWTAALAHMMKEAMSDSADWKVRLRCPMFERIFTEGELARLPPYSLDISKEDVLKQDPRTTFGVISTWRDLLLKSWQDPAKREMMAPR